MLNPISRAPIARGTVGYMATPELSAPAAEITPEQRAAMDAWLAAHPYGEQDENGIDLSLLRKNLKLTPTQRLHRLECAANSLRELTSDARTRN